MTAKYLLQCPCGRDAVVDRVGRARQSLVPVDRRCWFPRCWKWPSLEPARAESLTEPKRSAWGLRQRLWLLGAVLLLAAVGGGVWLYAARPISRFAVFSPELLQENAKDCLRTNLERMGSHETGVGSPHRPTVRGPNENLSSQARRSGLRGPVRCGVNGGGYGRRPQNIAARVPCPRLPWA